MESRVGVSAGFTHDGISSGQTEITNRRARGQNSCIILPNALVSVYPLAKASRALELSIYRDILVHELPPPNAKKIATVATISTP